MTKKRAFKRKIRARAAKTGESFTAARAHLVTQQRQGTVAHSAPTVRLRGPPRFGTISFVIEGNWGWEWLESESYRASVFGVLERLVRAEQPEHLSSLQAALTLFARASDEVVVESLVMDGHPDDFWMGINLNVVEDVKVGVFLRAIHAQGWVAELEPHFEAWGYFREAARPAAEFLRTMVDHLVQDGQLGSNPPIVEIDGAIVASLRLDEAACRASLGRAEALLPADALRVDDEEVPDEFLEKGTAEAGYVSTIAFGDGREMRIVIGESYRVCPRGYATAAAPRDCVLLAVDHAVVPSAAWIRWSDTNRHVRVNIDELSPP